MSVYNKDGVIKELVEILDTIRGFCLEKIENGTPEEKNVSKEVKSLLYAEREEKKRNGFSY